MIGSGLVCFKPKGGVAPRNHVFLHPKRGHKKIVDHILRGHDELDRPTGGNMQLVDFRLALGMLNFPHPLFGHDVDLQRVIRLAAPRARSRRSSKNMNPAKINTVPTPASRMTLVITRPYFPVTGS